MNLRLRLTLQFAMITMVLNLLAYASIYLLTENYRSEEFYNRLFDKAVNTAKLLIDVNEIDKDLLKIIDRNTTSLQDEKVVVYNYKDIEIYNSRDEEGKDYKQEILDKIRLNKELRFRDGKNECYGLLYTGEYDRYVVIAEAYDLYGVRKLNNLKLVLFIVFVCSMLAVFFAGWLFAGQTLKPIKRVIDEVDRIDDSNLNARVNIGNGKDEIAQLALAFNKMLEKVEEAFIIQKSFVSHASHELRTPLTAMTGQIEVTLMNQRTDAEYQKALLSVLEDIKSLTQLSNGLLILAQANTQSLISKFKKTRIDEIVFSAGELVSKKNPHYDIRIAFENEPEDVQDLMILGDEHLLRSAFINLLDNACKFSIGHITKAVFIFQNKYIEIKIIDEGIGIPDKDLPHIFTPFYRGINTHSYKGYGLGLSLTKKILDMHNASINILTSLTGTQISVRLPHI